MATSNNNIPPEPEGFGKPDPSQEIPAEERAPIHEPGETTSTTDSDMERPFETDPPALEQPVIHDTVDEINHDALAAEREAALNYEPPHPDEIHNADETEHNDDPHKLYAPSQQGSKLPVDQE